MKKRYADIAKRLIQLRKAFGFHAQKDFYVHLGLIDPSERQTKVSNWEGGTSQPSPQETRAIKDALGITSDWLYYGDRRGLSQDLLMKLPVSDQETDH